MKIAGILLLVIGLGLTLFTGFTYFTKEKVVDVAGIEISRHEPHHVNIPMVFSIAVMGVGGILLLASYKKK
jgi:multisubunit Na+/H+ antiporter MnhB subunit